MYRLITNAGIAQKITPLMATGMKSAIAEAKTKVNNVQTYKIERI